MILMISLFSIDGTKKETNNPERSHISVALKDELCVIKYQ